MSTPASRRGSTVGQWDAAQPSGQSRTSLTRCSAPWLNTTWAVGRGTERQSGGGEQRGSQEEGDREAVRRRGTERQSGGGGQRGSQEEGDREAVRRRGTERQSGGGEQRGSQEEGDREAVRRRGIERQSGRHREALAMDDGRVEEGK